MVYDLAVVGAGVAGSLAAYQGAIEGLKVALLEKESLPRYKTCGGAITVKTLDLLSSRGISLPSEVLGREVREMKVVSPRGGRSYRIEGGSIFLTYRSVLDNFLAKKAEEAGAELMEGARVKGLRLKEKARLESDRGSVDARYVVGADGFHSPIAREAGIRKRFPPQEMGVAAEYELEGRYDKEAMEIHFGDCNYGYAWVFPKQEGLTIGIAERGDRLEVSIRQKLKEFAHCQGMKNLPRARTSALPMGGVKRGVVRGRVALAGDAAGFVEPLAGEGTYYAALSGILAAEVVGRGEMEEYQVVTDRELLPDLRALRRVANMFYLNLDFSSYLLMESSIMRSAISVLSTGKPSPRELHSQALLHTLKALPGYARERVARALGS